MGAQALLTLAEAAVALVQSAVLETLQIALLEKAETAAQVLLTLCLVLHSFTQEAAVETFNTLLGQVVMVTLEHLR